MATNNTLNEKATGFQSISSTGIVNGRTITGTANQIAVANGNGTAGNPVISLTSPIFVSGISFNSGTNILTTYSEGTWTPAISSSGAALTVTYAANGQVGRYTRFNKCVFYQSYNSLASASGTTGSVVISPLPFTPLSGANIFFQGATSVQNCSYLVVKGYEVLVSGGSTNLGYIGAKPNALNLGLAASGVGNTAIFITSGEYLTA